jgi:hypothetical protein
MNTHCFQEDHCYRKTTGNSKNKGILDEQKRLSNHSKAWAKPAVIYYQQGQELSSTEASAISY